MSPPRILRAWARLRRDRRGVAAVEFALLIPFLLVLFFGGYQVTQAISAYRKMTDTTIQLGNVAAQYTSMSATDISNVFNASAQIMSPYATSNLKITLSEITTNPTSVATVRWSCAYNGAATLPLATIAMPAGLATPSATFLYVQTWYTWTPAFASSFTSNVPMSDTVFVIPRNSASVPNTPAGCPP